MSLSPAEREDRIERYARGPARLKAALARVPEEARKWLAEHFLAELNAAEGTAKRLTAAGRERLRRHGWPGNLRELRNVLQRGFILAEEGEGVDPIPERVVDETASSSLLMPVGTPLEEAERLLILATLEKFEGDKKRAAAALHISLNTLYTRLNEYKSS